MRELHCNHCGSRNRWSRRRCQRCYQPLPLEKFMLGLKVSAAVGVALILLALWRAPVG